MEGEAAEVLDRIRRLYQQTKRGYTCLYCNELMPDPDDREAETSPQQVRCGCCGSWVDRPMGARFFLEAVAQELEAYERRDRPAESENEPRPE